VFWHTQKNGHCFVFFPVFCCPKSCNTNELQVKFFYMDSAFLFKMALHKRRKKQNVEIARVLRLEWENWPRQREITRVLGLEWDVKIANAVEIVFPQNQAPKHSKHYIITTLGGPAFWSGRAFWSGFLEKFPGPKKSPRKQPGQKQESFALPLFV
jgi:hypothetical protein